MYTIKQASLRSGVGIPLIRAWERRYGVLHPRRTTSGYRLYDDEAIAMLIRVRRLTEAGWSASEASRAILAGEVTPDGRLPAAAPPPPAEQYGDLQKRFVEAALAIDPGALAIVLDEMFARASFEVVADDLLMPALARMGDAWADGSLDIGAEHAATAAVQRRLASLYEAAALTDAPGAVVGLPPGSRHELGALALGIALRRRGVGVLYLGADVPAASWAEVMDDPRNRLAIVGVAMEGDRPAALEVIRAIRARASGRLVAIGGGAASDWDEGREAGAIALPGRLGDAARMASEMMSTGVTPRHP